MKIADGVMVLELVREVLGQKNIIYPTLIGDEETAFLADTGFPGQFEALREAMAGEGIPFGKLQGVIITHQDIDHIGCLADFVRESNGSIKVYAHAAEKPYIQGEKPLIKQNSAQMGRFLASLPEEQRRQIAAVFANPPRAKVDHTVADGEMLPYGGGVTVIATPGHTPGHICLYLNRSKTLIAGDALTVSGSELKGPNPQATADPDLALRSLKKLLQYDIETVVCYHGGIYQQKVKQRLAELAKEE
jgi:glyoxylase-like metal-dependent hydrolase (beta-lactamase superfamily II)